MCLDTVEWTRDPSNINEPWRPTVKIFCADHEGRLFSVYHDAEIERLTETLLCCAPVLKEIVAFDGCSYNSGWHVYCGQVKGLMVRTVPSRGRCEVLREVAVRAIVAGGTQDGYRVLVAEELFILPER